MNQKSKSFEAGLNRLDEIVRQLERGDVPLEQALELFREGTGLVGDCTRMLDAAELEVVKLSKGADGMPREEAFAHEPAE